MKEMKEKFVDEISKALDSEENFNDRTFVASIVAIIASQYIQMSFGTFADMLVRIYDTETSSEAPWCSNKKLDYEMMKRPNLDFGYECTLKIVDTLRAEYKKDLSEESEKYLLIDFMESVISVMVGHADELNISRSQFIDIVYSTYRIRPAIWGHEYGRKFFDNFVDLADEVVSEHLAPPPLKRDSNDVRLEDVVKNLPVDKKNLN